MNKIIVTNDLEKCINEIKYDEKIITDEFKVENVKELKEISYLTSKNEKTILIAAKKYNLISQNALLKILEEPPPNTAFILAVTSKYSLLETIKSRLPIEYKIFKKVTDINVDLSKINNDLIFDLLQKDLNKDEIKAICYDLINKKNLKKELNVLSNAIKMLELNIEKKAVLAYIMLYFKGK
ncbi:DNA polymerase III subunit delta' [Lebetimonas sp. JH292]|uniref:DNA polymerase III subunit delta' n=1 Tax=Lebetimonas sp. JH292 TaxID=990068 RepID=UPI000464CDD6|nr:DNA polymerase III subunit delta' [Lebetimonas sp. JH292]